MNFQTGSTYFLRCDVRVTAYADVLLRNNRNDALSFPGIHVWPRDDGSDKETTEGVGL